VEYLVLLNLDVVVVKMIEVWQDLLFEQLSMMKDKRICSFQFIAFINDKKMS
jgi:hypothetical protein